MDAHGTITLSPTGVLQAGSRHTFTFVYTVGNCGMREGGSLRISTPNDDWEMPVAPMHRYFEGGHERGGYDNGYCSYAPRNLDVSLASANPEAWIDLAAQECAVTPKLAGGWARHIIATVMAGDLVKGDTITILYGDPAWGEDRARVQRVAPTAKDHFRAYVDVTGSRDFVEIPSDALRELHVMAGPTTQFNVVAPAIVRPGEPFAVRISGMDAFRNAPAEPFEGDLRVSSDQHGVALPGTVPLAAEAGRRTDVPNVRILAEGRRQILVEPADGTGTRSVSNPVWCTNQPLNLYFGDLHCQSKYHSDSLGTPAEGYAYGRDVAALDFMGITDSAGCFKPDGWLETQEAARDFHEPGRFVTLKGFEYGATLGHRNVIYRDAAIEPVLNALPRNDPEGLFAYFRGQDVIIIPHHTKVWTEWRFHDPVLEPIAEAYSCWGSGVEERDPLWHKSIKPGAGLFRALDQGLRFGFIGSGDSHSGTPGRSYPADRQWCVDAKSGFACVYAPELTREGIFDALRERRCYATTGERMILEFDVNGAMMGSDTLLESPSQPRRIRVHVIGTDELDYLRIVKNNETLVRHELSGDEAFFEYTDTSPARDGGFTYVRVVQKDGNTAWSSPVWARVQE
ncbi:MAG: CehA/McbA family metallohydrolase [Victivallales bacterium]|jgi:hypothetical protein|nr:CehA/McbA family metallohydrolase [Victivallales bacterium]